MLLKSSTGRGAVHLSHPIVENRLRADVERWAIPRHMGRQPLANRQVQQELAAAFFRNGDARRPPRPVRQRGGVHDVGQACRGARRPLRLRPGHTRCRRQRFGTRRARRGRPPAPRRRRTRLRGLQWRRRPPPGQRLVCAELPRRQTSIEGGPRVGDGGLLFPRAPLPEDACAPSGSAHGGRLHLGGGQRRITQSR